MGPSPRAQRFLPKKMTVVGSFTAEQKPLLNVCNEMENEIKLGEYFVQG